MCVGCDVIPVLTINCHNETISIFVQIRSVQLFKCYFVCYRKFNLHFMACLCTRIAFFLFNFDLTIRHVYLLNVVCLNVGEMHVNRVKCVIKFKKIYLVDIQSTGYMQNVIYHKIRLSCSKSSYI